MKRFLKTALAAAALMAGAASANAGAVSFNGNLAGDNSVALFSFTIAADSDVSLRTWSYAGGLNAAGNAIGAGGFDAVLALYFGAGDSALLIGGNDDGSGVAVDPLTTWALDSLLDLPSLLAGTYTVALTSAANFANGPTLGDGFLGAGDAGFGGRSSAWALDISGVDSATALPEPSSLALALLGLVGAAGAGGARRTSRQPASAV
jgi:hypothetical protein